MACSKTMRRNNCMAPMSKKYIDNLREKPIKSCGDLVYDHLTSKCVKPEKTQRHRTCLSIKFRGIKINNKTKFQFIGPFKWQLATTRFVLQKYPTAKLMIPDDVDATTFNWRWFYDDDTDKFDVAVPEGFWEGWDTTLHDPAIQFMITMVTAKSSQGGLHANVLIYDKRTNEMERFDGTGTQTHESYNLPAFDKIAIEKFTEKTPPKFKYFSPFDYCPRKLAIFQARELDDIPGVDVTGNCAVWRLFYVDVRLANPKLTRKQVVNFATKKLEKVGSFYRFIKSYQIFVTQNLPKLD